eukprot:915043-Pyramimonas_sp.AAC.1
MDEEEFWLTNKNQWRRAAQADMKEAPLMKERLAAIGQHQTSSMIEATISDLHRWFVACRSGATIPIVKAVIDAATAIADKCSKATGTERESLARELLGTKAQLTRLEQLFTDNASPKKVRDLFEDDLAA